MNKNSVEMIAWALLIGASMIAIAVAEIARSHDLSLGQPIQVVAWLVLLVSGIFFVSGLFVGRNGEGEE